MRLDDSWAANVNRWIPWRANDFPRRLTPATRSTSSISLDRSSSDVLLYDISFDDFTGIDAPPDSASPQARVRKFFQSSILNWQAIVSSAFARWGGASSSAPICPLADTRLPLFLRDSAPRRGGEHVEEDAKHSWGRHAIRSIPRPLRYSVARNAAILLHIHHSLHHTPHLALLVGQREREAVPFVCRFLRARWRGEGHSFSRDSIKVTGFLILIRARACSAVLFLQHEHITLASFF